MDKRGILMVSFGTSHLDTMAKTIEVLEKEVAEQYPENPDRKSTRLNSSH